MAAEYKPPCADMEDDGMLKGILDILQPDTAVIIDTGHCKTAEEKKNEIYAALVRRGRSKEEAARIARAMALDDGQ